MDAVLPQESTKDQFEQMLQGLLLDRFYLAVQREERDFTVYDLVLANGGRKFAASAARGQGVDQLQTDILEGLVAKPMKLDDEGCPVRQPAATVPSAAWARATDPRSAATQFPISSRYWR